MKKKLKVLAVCILTALVLSVISCGSGTSTTTAPQTKTTAPATITGQKPTTTAVSDKPKYGGTITTMEPTDPLCCDSAANRMMTNSLALWWSYEQLLKFDWTRGPAGTGEFDNATLTSPEAQMAGELAESVEKPSPEVWVLNIRKGVHYHQVDSEAGRLVGGREMTADDVVWAYERLVHGPGAAMAVLQPRCAAAFKIEKTGPWQVTFTTPVQPVTAQWWVIEGGGYGFLYPHEIVEKYGDLNNWRNIVGTGPWIIVDWVNGSSVSLVRNPNYWGKNPIGPGKGDQLPYADKVRRLIIPDTSTQFAAVRTGKVDMMDGLTYDQFIEMRRTAPNMEYREYLGNGFANAHAVNFNLADKTKPWANVKVRQALMLAMDYDSIISGYFDGKAEKDTVLVNRNFAGKGYKPLSEMPASVQSLYSHDVERAKKLLAEAGYPNGFKAEMLVPNFQERIDEASIYKEAWAKLGVDITIAPTENVAFLTLVTRTFAWNDMFYGSNSGGTCGSYGFSLYTYLGYYRGDNRLQFASRTDPNGTPDPMIEAAFAETQKNLYVNWPATYKAIEDLRPYLIENAFKIPFPQPLSYGLWWPWMKNTFGQGPSPYLLKYYWIDQDLKKSMGY